MAIDHQTVQPDVDVQTQQDQAAADSVGTAEPATAASLERFREEIIKAYEQGVPLGKIGAQHGIGLLRVRELLGEWEVVPRLTNRQTAVVAEYEKGLTYEEIGALRRFRFTRERTRQILKECGVRSESKRDREYYFVTAGRAAVVQEAFLRLRSDEEVAREIGLPAVHVRRLVDEIVPDAGLLRQRARERDVQFSDDELVTSLRKAADEMGSPLTVSDYRRWATKQGNDERRVAGHQGMMLRFGGWNAALTRAGLPANPHFGPDRWFDLEDVLDGIVECWRVGGHYPSAREYEIWSTGRTEVPSLSTARKFASWRELLLAAYPLVHGVHLPGPYVPQLADDARHFIVGQDYSPASEETLVESTDLFGRDPQLQERALRSHATLQNKIHGIAKDAGRKVLSPRPSDPSFDVAWWDDAGRLVVVEVKSATPSNLEGQLRLGLGQLLHYGEQLGARGIVVRHVLAVELKPDEVWQSLCSRLGIRLVWPGVMQTILN